MGAIELILGIAIIVLAAILVLLVLFQSGKDKKLSGTIAGGADTYYGKNKKKSADKLLVRLTVIVSIIFAILVVFSYGYISNLHG